MRERRNTPIRVAEPMTEITMRFNICLFLNSGSKGRSMAGSSSFVLAILLPRLNSLKYKRLAFFGELDNVRFRTGSVRYRTVR